MRNVFYSFHYQNDNWRVQQVRNIGKMEGQPLLQANGWEEIKKKGEAAIKKWISDNLVGKSCVVVLVGSETGTRRWVRHEIIEAWNSGKAVLGIRIHKLLNREGYASLAGPNPFEEISLNSGALLSSKVSLVDPKGKDSKEVYGSISDSIESWVELAIASRKA